MLISLQFLWRHDIETFSALLVLSEGNPSAWWPIYVSLNMVIIDSDNICRPFDTKPSLKQWWHVVNSMTSESNTRNAENKSSDYANFVVTGGTGSSVVFNNHGGTTDCKVGMMTILLGFQWIPFNEMHLKMSSLNFIMTSWNGNIFRVTGHWCGEFTGPRWIPRTRASDAELWCFLWSVPE